MSRGLWLVISHVQLHKLYVQSKPFFLVLGWAGKVWNFRFLLLSWAPLSALSVLLTFDQTEEHSQQQNIQNREWLAPPSNLYLFLYLTSCLVKLLSASQEVFLKFCLTPGVKKGSKQKRLQGVHSVLFWREMTPAPDPLGPKAPDRG